MIALIVGCECVPERLEPPASCPPECPNPDYHAPGGKVACGASGDPMCILPGCFDNAGSLCG